MKICPKCGYKNKADANFCGNCQAPLNNVPVTSKHHSKLLMILVGIIVILIAILLFIMGMRSNNSTNHQQATQSSSRVSNNHSSASSQSSSQAPQEKFSDEEYELMAFLKLTDDNSDSNDQSNEMLQNLVNLDPNEKDNAVVWHPITNGRRIGFGAHTTELQVNGDHVNVTYDEIEGDHMGEGNGHKTYSKAELAREFKLQKDDIDKALANLEASDNAKDY